MISSLLPLLSQSSRTSFSIHWSPPTWTNLRGLINRAKKKRSRDKNSGGSVTSCHRLIPFQLIAKLLKITSILLKKDESALLQSHWGNRREYRCLSFKVEVRSMGYRTETRCLWVLVVVFICVGVAWSQEDCTLRTEDICSNYTDVGACNQTSGLCECNETLSCFRYDNSTNFCRLGSVCYSYDSTTEQCRFGRRSRLTALLLSIFLINFGAANFYIEQYQYAVPQIVLGLLLCVFQFGSCAVAGTRDNETSYPCIICCSINSVLSLLFLAWWIADLVIFALNSRLDGLGCPLET